MNIPNLNLKYNIGGYDLTGLNILNLSTQGFSGQEQLNSDYWSFSSYLKRNPQKKISISIEKTYPATKTKYNNIINEYLNLFFGPTGPGSNYGGTASYSIIYNNINGISLANTAILDQARILYSITNLTGITQINYSQNITRSRAYESLNPTPPINRIT